MPLQLEHRALYASFDRFPSAKGAATHIAHMIATLFELKEGGLLYAVGGDDLPVYQREGNVEIVRFAATLPNFLDRALGFGQRLEGLLDEVERSLEICHFRDPWSGVPILGRPHRYTTVYEVNGLPSIELPFAYPHLSRITLEKIRRAEEFCWSSADAIVTPSETIAGNLVRLGADARKITVIPNGADPAPHSSHPPPLSSDSYSITHPSSFSSYSIPHLSYILYFGALQRWQGIDILLRAFARLADLSDLHLVICASTHHRHAKLYRRLAERLGVAERVEWHYALGKEELGRFISHALLTVAPLIECTRNLEQGCSPLKVLESMAYGVPVVASDLPAVREIIDDGIDGRLVRPDRPADLARAIRVMIDYPEQLREMGAMARRKIEERFTWSMATSRLADLYRTLESAKPAGGTDEDGIFAPASNPSIDIGNREQAE